MTPRTVRIDPERFRSLCDIRGYVSQTALAAGSGVDQSTVSRMSRLPGPYELAKVRAIARALDLDDVHDLGLLGVPEEDVAALVRAATVRAKMARMLEKTRKRGSVKSATANRAGVQTARHRPMVAELATA